MVRPEWPFMEKKFKELERKREREVVFVGNMCDLFHEKVPDDFISRVFSEMFNQPRHTFLLLTKRAEHMRDFVNDYLPEAGYDMRRDFPHVWLGVTAENQQRANERIPVLLEADAENHWASLEPLLSPIDLTTLPCTEKLDGEGADYLDALRGSTYWPGGEHGANVNYLKWIAVGGENGAKARRMDPAWPRQLRDDCKRAKSTVFYFKGWGKYYMGIEPYHKNTTEVEYRGLDGHFYNDRPFITKGTV